MVIRNKIWEELKQAHVNVLCIRWYTNRQRKFERIYQLFIAMVASGGTFGYLLNDYAPLIGSGIIAFVSVAKSLFPNFLQPEKELCILDELMDFYNLYMNDMEYIFHKVDKKEITEKEAIDDIHEKKSKECHKQSIMNRFIRSIPPKREKKIEYESTQYINRVYFNKYEETKNN
jgi:hypothetical protein